MMHPLDGARAKLDWGNKHFKTLKAKIRNFPNEAKQVLFAQQFKSKGSTIQITVDAVPDYPLSWSLAVGDIVHNFRTALDYLAWELAKWNLAHQGINREPDRETQFPIADQRVKFPQRQIKDIHLNHIALLDWLQPYGPRSVERERTWLAAIGWIGPSLSAPETAFARSPLWKLRFLSNADKHQSLRMMATKYGSINTDAYEGIGCEILSTSVIAIDILKPGTLWAEFEVRPLSRKPQLKMNDHFTPEIAFENYWPVIASLSEISAEVAYIIRKFEAVFS